jgi:hypothetical protein
MKNIVFYSRLKADQFSPRLLEIMKHMPKSFQSEFVYYCVDPDPITKQRNNDILHLFSVTRVPTMYVDGTKYEGDDAFTWLMMNYNQMQTTESQLEPTNPMMMRNLEQFTPNMPGMHPTMPGMPSQPMPNMTGMRNMQHYQPLPPNMASGGINQDYGRAGSGDNTNGPQGNYGNAGDSSFANPFTPTDITGINSAGGNLNADELITPIHTKKQDMSTEMEKRVQMYAQEREAMLQSRGPPAIPGMNMNMSMT